MSCIFPHLFVLKQILHCASLLPNQVSLYNKEQHKTNWDDGWNPPGLQCSIVEVQWTQSSLINKLQQMLQCLSLQNVNLYFLTVCFLHYILWLAIILSIPLRLNAIWYNSPAKDSAFTKIIMFQAVCSGVELVPFICCPFHLKVWLNILYDIT